MEDCPAADLAPADVFLEQTGSGGTAEWAILTGQECGVTINGIPLLLGLRVLIDRDEIRWGPDAFAFYSTEEPADIASLPQGDRKIFCPRCKQEITPGTPAVRCPRCGIWHHQSEQLPCYTYAERCATCTRRASLDSSYDWTPEEM
jgi:Zn finger protein HypA/HybF involved in hydrogenase expression